MCYLQDGVLCCDTIPCDYYSLQCCWSSCNVGWSECTHVQATVEHGANKGPCYEWTPSTTLHSHTHSIAETSHCLVTCLEICACATPSSSSHDYSLGCCVGDVMHRTTPGILALSMCLNGSGKQLQLTETVAAADSRSQQQHDPGSLVYIDYIGSVGGRLLQASFDGTSHYSMWYTAATAALVAPRLSLAGWEPGLPRV